MNIASFNLCPLIFLSLQLKKMHMKKAEKLDAATGFTVTAVEPEDLPAEKSSPMFPYDLTYTPPSLIRYILSAPVILYLQLLHDRYLIGLIMQFCRLQPCI